MTTSRRQRYERLLRWYPARWRRVHSLVVLETLEENADSLNLSRPTRGEAWSLRAHGIAERASPGLIMMVAAVSLVFSVVSVGVVMTGAVAETQWQTNVRFAVQFFGVFLISAAAGALVLRAGRIAAEPALAALALSAGAWALGAAAFTAWSVGFDEADTGVTRSWFGETFPFFAGGAWLLGSCALFLVAYGLLGGRRSGVPGLVLAAVIAVPSALAIGVSSAMPTGTVMAAAVVLIVASVQFRAQPTQPKRHSTPGVLQSGQRNRIAALASLAAVLGIGCAVFALMGSLWFPAVGNSTDAMRVGLLGGAIVAVITVAAGAEILVTRRGRGALWPAGSAIGALLAVACSYSLGIDDPRAWPLLIVAALLAGLTGGLLLAPLLLGRAVLRTLLVLAVSVALAVAIGVVVVTAIAFLAPVFAVILAITMIRRPSHPSGNLHFAPPVTGGGLGRPTL